MADTDKHVPAPSTEAVERGARALAAEEMSYDDDVWAKVSEESRESWRKLARAVLAAASPDGQERAE